MNNQSIVLNDFLINYLTDKAVAREFLNASLETDLEEGNVLTSSKKFSDSYNRRAG